MYCRCTIVPSVITLNRCNVEYFMRQKSTVTAHHSSIVLAERETGRQTDIFTDAVFIESHTLYRYKKNTLLIIAYHKHHVTQSHPSAICLLKDREPGAFVIRDSHSFKGAYGLAMKVASPPPTVQQNKKGNISQPVFKIKIKQCH